MYMRVYLNRMKIEIDGHNSINYCMRVVCQLSKYLYDSMAVVVSSGSYNLTKYPKDAKLIC